MLGYARVHVSEEAIFVRFEKMGNLFHPLMDRFNQAFQVKTWVETKRAWQLPPGDLDALIQFCKMNLGSRGYIIEKQVITMKEPSQLMRE